MDNSFPTIGASHAGFGGDNSFWPSFTDVMMVITLIFLMATSLLVVRNWQLVAELKDSVAAEQIAEEIIASSFLENATLEERLVNAEQSNSILRLRLLKRDEEILIAQAAIREQESSIASLELERSDLQRNQTALQNQLATATLEIDTGNTERRELANQIENLNQQLGLQQLQQTQTRAELDQARVSIAELTESTSEQVQNIQQLTRENSLLTRQAELNNQQLLSLQGEYDSVRTEYEKLIRPARSAKGKYIAEVRYLKQADGDLIRFRHPEQTEFQSVNREEVEAQLAALKQQHGKRLYIKIIIPEDSGLTYNEAWTFMRELLVEYDYYYQK